MTIIEAMNKGLEFKRPFWPYYIKNHGQYFTAEYGVTTMNWPVFTPGDIIANDYVIRNAEDDKPKNVLTFDPKKKRVKK